MPSRPDRDLERFSARAPWVANPMVRRPRLSGLALLALASALAGCERTTERADVPAWTLRETVRIGSGDEGPTSFSWVKGLAEV